MELLEREPFIDELAGLLREATVGRGRLVLIGAEAGGGKTALVQRVTRAAGASARVLVGGCDPLSTPRPLGPLVDIAGALRGEVERLLREAAPRDAVFRAFLAELAGGRRPALVVIEDIHWADEATLDLLRFLGRRVATARALLLATYRDDEVGPRHPLQVALGDLATAAAVRRVALPPLSESAVRALADGSGLDPEALHRRTGGNPFFVTEALAAGAPGIPPTVRDAVLGRVARLTPAGRAALEAAAVIGARVEPRLLAAVVGAAAEAGEAAEECVAAGMLRAEGDLLAFRHELGREAVLDAVTPARRLALHRAVLAALRSSPIDADDLDRLAHHAEVAGDAEAVLAYAPAAARRAAGLSAHREAAAQYARALRFADALAPAERAGLLESYARECRITDQLAEAIRAWEAALALRRQLDDPSSEGEALAWLAGALVLAGRNAEAERASLAAIQALEALPPAPRLAVAYRIQANLRMLNRDTGEAVAWGERALALAERFQATEIVVAAHTTIGSALLVAGDLRGIEHLERSLALARQAGLAAQVGNAYGNLGSALGEIYQFALADRYLTEGIAFTTEHDLDFSRLYMVAWSALVRLHQGRWREATEAALAVVNRPGGAAISRIMALVALGRVRARRGDPDVAVVLDEALTLAEQTGTLQRLAPVRAARAEAAWLAGDRAATLAEARAAFALAEHHRHAWHLGELGLWRWRAGDLETPSPGAAAPFALQMAGDWAGAAAEWGRLGCPYEAARALADAGDEAAVRRALAEFERLGARPAAVAAARRLRDLGARSIPRGPRPATRANPAGLTPREVEIARLLAAGLRDAEIAARLSLSAKTVGHHVSAVLTKLGARGRTEAAGAAARLGLVPQDGENGGPR
jgi:predicted ATPase/DNA-binding CsgD family transcriptional regulator